MWYTNINFSQENTRSEEKRLSNKIKETEQKEQNFLYEKLKEYCSSDAYPFHMPGHKRNKTLIKELLGGVYGDGMPYQIDITEIDGFDNLHHAEEILLEGQKRAADLYGAEESFYLINGSTCGILASVFACTAQKGKILMARNCHKAVFNALTLGNIKPVYAYPEEEARYGIAGVTTADEIDRLMREHPEAKAVVLPSPNYYGICSDIAGIAETVHSHDGILIVDQAHGAHLKFMKDQQPRTAEPTSSWTVFTKHWHLSHKVQCFM